MIGNRSWQPSIRFTLLLAAMAPLGACAVPGDAEPDPSVQDLATGSGLRGEYYDNADLTSLKLTRDDATVDFDWGTGSPAAQLGSDTFSVRWTGQVVPQYSETYTFATDSDDGVRLWVDDVLVIDDWTHHALAEHTGTVVMHAGQPRNVRLEYFENTGQAVARLSWSSASQARQIVPATALYPSNYATEHGAWAASATMSATATTASMWQAPAVAAHASYVASVVLRGTGSIELEVQAGYWTGSVVAHVRCDATGAWTTCATPAFATGANTRMTWRVVDAYGTAGRVWLDDTFLGIAGGANTLTNGGFESGVAPWGGASGAVFAVQQLVGAPANTGTADAGHADASHADAASGADAHDAAAAADAASPDASTPSARIYWGATLDGATYQYLYGGTHGNPPWDLTTWDLFDSHAGKNVGIIAWHNDPPWVHDFNYWVSTYETVRGRGAISEINLDSESVPLRDIANGVYDASIRTWVQQAAAYGHPFFLRWDWEMNASWFAWGTMASNANTPADYVAAWRHFHDLAVAAGARNITWVWCPNIDSHNAYTPFSALYPGDAYVDWTALDGYNQGTATESFAALFTTSYHNLLAVAPSKPILIAETASMEYATGVKAAWITDALGTQLPRDFPQVRGVVWFNWRFASGGVWQPFEIESSSSSQTAFENAIRGSYYAPGGSFGSLPLHEPIAPL